MKIVLPRTEVETAVKANLVKDGIVLEGKNVAMKFTANTVEVNITDVVPAPEAIEAKESKQK